MFARALFQALHLQRMYAFLVGANLFAKTLFLTINLQWMYRPLREQCGSPPRSLPQERGVSDHSGARRSPCSRGLYFRRYIFSGCTLSLWERTCSRRLYS
ncbi:hypothetical protein CU668_20295 [Pseudomonas syringae pv. actinidifoliorum]|nr:hypothetical protein [Pseudomonas syringae pv. actinidifoliorum]